MKIIPAIDLKDGSVVRLTQGDFDRVVTYAYKPEEAAASFYEQGARWLHVVDLDGARDGVLSNYEAVKKIVSQNKMSIEVGGGIRDAQRILKYLDIGVDRVILGTAALEDFGFLRRMRDKFGDQIMVGVDAKDGCVAVKGWKEVSGTDSFAFCEKLQTAGIASVIYTDISKDGAMSGTNIAVYERLLTLKRINIIASGGISSYEELEKLKNLGVYGAILGKSLYSGILDLKKAIDIAGEQ